ncbi:MAG TPA: hypothetical protein VK005_01845 [Acholeplasma sp.]|nr:hypothetical protein [Acholeplasma sp.]
MARVNKKDVVKKEKVVVEQSGITGIKEESQKGELFFKMVLIVMAVALFGLIIYFVVDALIGDDNQAYEERYSKNNYVTSTQVAQVANLDNFENIAHEGLKYALDRYEYVYILFYADQNTDGLTSSTKNRQDAALAVMDEIMATDVKEIKLTVNDEDYIFVVVNDDIAFFFLDTSLASNSEWISSVDTSEGQAATAQVPTLLEVHNGEDINWYGAWSRVDSNISTLEKLEQVLASLA